MNSIFIISYYDNNFRLSFLWGVGEQVTLHFDSLQECIDAKEAWSSFLDEGT